VRLDDIRHYLRLRTMVERPWAVVRFRKEAVPGRTLEVAFRDGRRLRLVAGGSDYHVFREVFLEDAYRLGRCRADLDTVVDVGANVGFFAVRAAGLARRVVCFEPARSNLERLAENVAGCPNVETVRAAIAGSSGHRTLYRPSGAKADDLYSLHPTVGDATGAAHEQVAAIDLDEAFVRHRVERCDLLKIDVEGGEYEILGSASASTLGRVERICCEYHDVRPRTPENRWPALVRVLEAHGFEVERAPHPTAENLGLVFARRV
jgi:FkbM family methyltransferase